MDVVHLSIFLGLFVLKVAGVLVIIYGPMIVGARWLPRVDNRGLFLQPLSWFLPLMTGAILGAGLLYSNIHQDYFTVNTIFQIDGPWGLSYESFFFERANPFNYSFEALLDRTVNPADGTNLIAALIISFASFALFSFKSFTQWRSLGAFRGILYGAAIALWACYMTIFVVCLLIWLLNLLNFWTLAIVTILVHLHRSHNFPVHFSTVIAPVVEALHAGHGHNGHHHPPARGSVGGKHYAPGDYESGGRLPHEREQDEDEVEIPASLTQSVP